MNIMVTLMYRVRRADDGQIEIYENSANGLNLTRTATLAEAVEQIREMHDDVMDPYFEVDVVNVHPVNDKHLLDPEVKS